MKNLSNYLLLGVGFILLVNATNPLNAQIFAQADMANLGITSSPAEAINPDGGFEEATLGAKYGNDIPGWTLSLDGTASADFEVVDYDVKEGSHSLYVELTGLGSNAWDAQIVNEPITFQPNTQYTLSIWARADKEGSIVNFTVGSPTYTEWGRAHQQVITSEWKQFTLAFTTPATATTGRAPIHLGEAANNPLLPVGYYFDDLQIVPVTGVETKKPTTPVEYSLSQNYPNPFNPTTTIQFNLAHRANVLLEVVNEVGEVVKVIANGSYAEGNHQVLLDASDMATGIYLYRLTANGYIDVKKMVLMK